ncbi:hypothetical protein [Altericista sp. CCNU0014]|uniref:hypothetical protein n=1 Tax=Altericista sp. CCNU0014 TaxID=3082949 RepID=UPI00384F38F6
MLRSLQVLKMLALGIFFALAAPRLNDFLMAVSQERGEGGQAIAALSNGDYQYCSKPDPIDGRDEDGVCFILKKTDKTIAGYYGYPNSDNYICIRGTADANQIQGEGLALSWPGAYWAKIPNVEFTWDAEGHLKLSKGEIIRSANEGTERLDWVRFHKAMLNIRNFYRYRSPRMTSPSQLCDWPK